MSLHFVSESLEGYILDMDVFNTQGILLLQKGHVLTARDISFLQTHHVYSVHASAPDQEEARKVEQPASKATSATNDPEETSPFSYQVRIKLAQENYEETVHQLQDQLNLAKEQDKVDVDELCYLFVPLFQISKEQRNLFHSLAFSNLGERDKLNYLAAHSLNTALIASTMASLIDCTVDEILEMGKAALLHDIGKVKLPTELLEKAIQGKLNEDERETYEQHPRLGYELLRNSEAKTTLMLEGALYHHERMDGTGYPSGLSKQKIPLVAQLIATASMYDKITSNPLMGERLSPYFACKALMDATYDGYLNPEIVTPFVNFVSEAYIGDYVRLNTGEEGKIIHIHRLEPHLPTIQLSTGEFIDLQQAREVWITEIIQA